MKALIAEFLYKSAVRCNQPQTKQAVLTWALTPSENTVAAAKEELSNLEKSKNEEASFEKLKAELTSIDPSGDLVKRLELVGKHIPQYSEEHDNFHEISGGGGGSGSFAQIYAFAQLGSLLKTITHGVQEEKRESLRKFETKISQTLQNILKTPRWQRNDSMGNSKLQSYSAAIAILNHPGSERLSWAIEPFVKWRELSQKLFGDPNLFPYSMLNTPDEYSVKASKKNRLSSAARSVPIQLAIFLHDHPDKKFANADPLIRALVNYDEHFFQIFSGIVENRTHDRTVDEHLAPYYGPSTIPYFFRAITQLKAEKHLPKDQLERLDELSHDVTQKFLAMFQRNGLFKEQHPAMYGGALNYDNALAGLALHEACNLHETRACGNSSSQTGPPGTPPAIIRRRSSHSRVAQPNRK